MEMNTSRRLRMMNRIINVRPVVSFASKFVGSGPNRLKMVKFSHQLSDDMVPLDIGR